MKLRDHFRTSPFFLSVCGLLALWPVHELNARSEVMRLAAREPVLALHPLDDTLIAVGARGHILESTDGGESWIQVASPVRRILTSMCETPGGRLFVTGYEATLLERLDADGNFVLRHQFEDEDMPLFACHFTSETDGMAVGAYGLLLTTDDGGQTWQDDIIDDDEPHVYGLAEAPDGSFVLAATEFGLILKQMPGEKAWQRVYEDYGGSLFGMAVTAEGHFTAYGLNGFALSSKDGENWTEWSFPTATSVFSSETTDDRTLFAGSGGFIHAQTSDDITTVTLSDRISINDLTGLPDAPGLLIVGANEGLFRLDHSDPEAIMLTPLEIAQ